MPACRLSTILIAIHSPLNDGSLMDSNSKQIAEVMMDWIDKHASMKSHHDASNHGHH
jgi:hypothetical protein